MTPSPRITKYWFPQDWSQRSSISNLKLILQQLEPSYHVVKVPCPEPRPVKELNYSVKILNNVSYSCRFI